MGVSCLVLVLSSSTFCPFLVMQSPPLEKESCVLDFNCLHDILRKTIEGYLDSVPSLTFNTIRTKLIMNAFYSSRCLQ